jgi:HSP20 family molecular chaperone IbpA
LAHRAALFPELQAVLETIVASGHITRDWDSVPTGPDRGGRSMKGNDMARGSLFSSPLLLGFEDVERLLEQASRNGDGYPPYNIERFPHRPGEGERLRITLALAGFSREELEITVEDNQLIIRGRQSDEAERAYLHRGIAARRFQRAFVLADGMEVRGARLANGLLTIDLERPEPQRATRRIEIKGA